MMRTLVTIDENDIRALDEVAITEKVSRAELIRQAIREHLDRRAKTMNAANSGDAFGLWGKTAKDGLLYQQQLRDEW